MTRRFILAVAAFAALLARDAMAGEAVLTGAVVTLAGKSVPLPGTGWRIIAEGEAGTGADRMLTAILARIRGEELAALAVVRANPQPRNAIHPMARDCIRRDSYFAAIRYDTSVDGYCDFGNLVLPDWRATEGSWGVAAQALRAAIPRLPAGMLETGAQARNLAHAVDVRFYLPAPGEAANNWVAHPLSPAAGLTSPAVALQAAQLAAFAWVLQPELERGLHGQLPAGNPPLPEPGDLGTMRAHRLAALEGRLGDGGLAPVDRAAMLREAEAAQRVPERQPWSLEARSFAKVVPYRIASTVDTLLVSWLVTGSAAQTLGFAGVNAVVKPVLAYVNELAWASSGVGRPRASLVPVELGSIGADRAP